MFKPPQLKARQKRNIGLWTMEFIVVVLGVLLALWAQAWFENRNRQTELRAVEKGMHEELAMNAVESVLGMSMIECHSRRTAEIRQVLLESGDNWPGISGDAIFEPGASRHGVPTVMSMSGTSMSLSNWEYLERSGLLREMSADQRQAYANAFELSAFIQVQYDTARLARDRLSNLVYPGTLTPELRAESLRALKDMDTAFQLWKRDHPRLIQAIKALDVRPTAQMDVTLKIFMDDLQGQGKPATCFSMPTNPLRDSK